MTGRTAYLKVRANPYRTVSQYHAFGCAPTSFGGGLRTLLMSDPRGGERHHEWSVDLSAQSFSVHLGLFERAKRVGSAACWAVATFRTGTGDSGNPFATGRAASDAG